MRNNTRTPAEHRKLLQDLENRTNRIQPLDMREKLVHVHSKLRRAMIKAGIEIPFMVRKQGYAPVSNIKAWERATGTKNEGDTPIAD